MIKDTRHTLRSKVKQAQPRLCVALDYMELVGGEPVFSAFMSTHLQGAGGDFELILGESVPTAPFIKDIKLHFVESETMAYQGRPITWQVTKQQGRILTLQSDDWLDATNNYLAARVKHDFITYLSVHFRSDNLQRQTAFANYDFDSPWTFPVKLEQQGLNSEHFRWVIRRNREEPSDKDFNDFPNELMEFQA